MSPESGHENRTSRCRAWREACAKWRRHTRVEQRLFLESLILLALARLAILTLPFRWLAFSLGKHRKEADQEIGTTDLMHAQMVGQAIRSAANYTPWQSLCLAQAVAAQWMLKLRRIPGTLYLGVGKDKRESSGLTAHAWLRCGNYILTGAAGHQTFTVVSTFS